MISEILNLNPRISKKYNTKAKETICMNIEIDYNIFLF